MRGSLDRSGDTGGPTTSATTAAAGAAPVAAKKRGLGQGVLSVVNGTGALVEGIFRLPVAATLKLLPGKQSPKLLPGRTKKGSPQRWARTALGAVTLAGGLLTGGSALTGSDAFQPAPPSAAEVKDKAVEKVGKTQDNLRNMIQQAAETPTANPLSVSSDLPTMGDTKSDSTQKRLDELEK